MTTNQIMKKEKTKRKPKASWFKEQGTLHIETDNCIVNVKMLRDDQGEPITNVDILPDHYDKQYVVKIVDSEPTLPTTQHINSFNLQVRKLEAK